MLRAVAAARPMTVLAASRVSAARSALVGARRWNQQAPAESHIFDENDALRRRLLYRSKQRGWLEMDIMLGGWARDNLGALGEEELQQFQAIIDMENPDLFRWLTGQTPVPEDVGNPLLVRLIGDLNDAMEPKVTVASAKAFEGKVWE